MCILAAGIEAPQFTGGTEQVRVRLNETWSREVLVVSRYNISANVTWLADNSSGQLPPNLDDIPTIESEGKLDNVTYRIRLR